MVTRVGIYGPQTQVKCLLKALIFGTYKNKSPVVGLHPTTESNLRTGLSVEIYKHCIITRIWKPLSRKFSDLCREMGICLQI